MYKNCYLHELEFLSLVFLITPEVKGSSLRDLTKNQFRKLINLYKEYCPPFVHIEDEELTKMENDHCKEWETVKSIFFTRMALLQFKHQVHEFIHLYRYHWFFTFKSEKIDMEQIIINQYGFKFDDYVKLATALFSYSMHCNDNLLYKEILTCFEDIKFSNEKTANMLKNLTISRTDICNIYEHHKSNDKRLMIYDCNPLRQNPIVYKVGEEKIYLPIPQFLFCAITKGFYHTLFDKNKEIKQNFGKEVFEKYVQHVLTWKKPDFSIIPEFRYSVGRNVWDSPDIMLARGNEIIMIEVKATAPTLQLGVANSEHYVNQLVKAYSVGIEQCVKKEEHIRNGCLTHPDLPETIGKIYYVVITLEEFYMVHTEFFHNQIKLAVKEKRDAILPDDRFYHLMGVSSLETIIENDTRSFFDYIIERELSGRAFSALTSSDINNKLQFGELRSVKYFSKVMDEVIGR